MLSDSLKHVNKIATSNNNLDVDRSKEQNVATISNERNSRSILFLNPNNKCNIMLESLCAKLDQVKIEEPKMVK